MFVVNSTYHEILIYTHFFALSAFFHVVQQSLHYVGVLARMNRSTSQLLVRMLFNRAGFLCMVLTNILFSIRMKERN